jgi:hypothetical protein
MKIELDRDLVKNILAQENFYNSVPEFFFMKEMGSKIAEALSAPGGCSSCTENNLITPAIMTFISHSVNMYLDCGPESCVKLKNFIKEFIKCEEDLTVGIFYKENEEKPVEEILL